MAIPWKKIGKTALKIATKKAKVTKTVTKVVKKLT